MNTAPPAVHPPAAALAGGVAGADALRELVRVALAAVESGARARGGPLPAGGPEGVAAEVARVLGTTAGAALPAARGSAAAGPSPSPGPSPNPGPDPLPALGVGESVALRELSTLFAWGAADPADPRCAGHLHCPPLAVAVAADLVASALNPSLDSWDQAPVAGALEVEVVAALAGLVGFAPGAAGGVVTSGGTESNLMGLLLARDGLGPGVGRRRILCSQAAHFSVRRCAGLLGLGEDAVVTVPAGADHRMDPVALADACRRVLAGNDRIAAIVATAGTTDLGAVEPLPAIASVAREFDTWLHVDAAYGGGALFSDRLAPLLTGLDEAHSVGLDLHKLGWQPIAAGVFLVRDAALLEPLAQRAAYLNPDDDEQAGYFSLLGNSPRTTRRADVFKIAVTLRALGRTGLGALVDRCHDLARYAADLIRAHPRLELVADPVLTSVVFRYVPERPVDERDTDRINAALRRRLLHEGRAVVGRTEIGSGPGAVRLKLTLLNPHAGAADLDALLAAVLDAGRAESTQPG
ncbi:pyridoxal phosphate-dependent decarboxylase family protein [Embleya sp. NBC_00896]|uniref:pyridoxal phosphate-dependent decarboxylase family protein n=1 Tax=Embleya sp. NBC_00896 TaxID=2975961 RepID=UPI00386D2F28|nr:pyridoxal-dependent decarboxylase [Embleya sp. NBC_00896]